jgi:hypothetical protein
MKPIEESIEWAILAHMVYTVRPKVESMPRKPFKAWLKRLPLALYHNYLYLFDTILASMIYVEDH